VGGVVSARPSGAGRAWQATLREWIGRQRGPSLDERTQALDRAIPPGGDAVEEGARVVDAPGIDGVEHLAPALGVADQASVFEHLEMLDDRLARDGRAVGERRRGQRAGDTEPFDQGEAR